MLEKIFLILAVILSLLSLNTTKLRRAIIYMGLFSLVSSFVYLLYSAPDVAIAEAVIGSALSTVLFLVALKKIQVFTIYYINENNLEINDIHIVKAGTLMLRDIERIYAKKELEPLIIYTSEDYKYILETKNYDLLIHQKEDKVNIYGCAKDYQLDVIQHCLIEEQYENLEITIIPCEEEDDYDS